MIETIRFTPPWLVPSDGEKGKKQGKQPAPPTFTLRAGSIIERDQFEAELEGRFGAGMVLGFRLLEAAVGGVRALLGEEGIELEELLRAEFAAAASSDRGGELSPQEKARLKATTEILARNWPEYAGLVEQEARRNQILPTLAFVQWCAGWENVVDREGAPVVYERGPTGDLPDHLLRRVPFTMIRAAGLEAYALQYGRAHAKN